MKKLITENRVKITRATASGIINYDYEMTNIVRLWEQCESD